MVLKIRKTTDFSYEELKECFEKLDKNEQQLILKKKNDDAKKCSLAARVLLLYSLDENYGINNAQIKRTANGKPYLTDNKVYFSISHTRDTVAVAISDTPVGIDIEYKREYNDGVSRRFFSKNEQEFVNGDDTNFTKLWTLKESAVKATGQGIAYAKDYIFDICRETVISNLKNANFTVKHQDGLIISVCEIK